jgi:hypothetical protein
MFRVTLRFRFQSRDGNGAVARRLNFSQQKSTPGDRPPQFPPDGLSDSNPEWLREPSYTRGHTTAAQVLRAAEFLDRPPWIEIHLAGPAPHFGVQLSDVRRPGTNGRFEIDSKVSRRRHTYSWQR